MSPNFTIRNNYIHHNVGNASSSNPGERGGGYQGFRSDNTTFDSNEIAYNGPEQKVGLSANVTFRNNFVHHNLRDGIWYDTNSNAGALIDGNRVEDNGRNGIFFEASIGATIRSNTVRRHAGDGVLISMSQNAQIYNNTLDGNFSSIEYFLNCDSLALGEDVKNNAAYDNTVVVGTQSYASASGFSYLSSCSATQLAPYLNGSKNLTFSRNTYRVPSLSGRYLFWGGWKYWNEWQALGHGYRRQHDPVAAEAGPARPQHPGVLRSQQDIDYVTMRNLVIPQHAPAWHPAFYYMAPSFVAHRTPGQFGAYHLLAPRWVRDLI